MSEIILTERVLMFEYVSELGVYGSNSNPSLFLPVEGEKYVVVWDGNEYTCEAFTDDSQPGMVMVGNTLVVGGNDSGEPFAIVSKIDGEGMTIFALEAKETHTISVRHENAGETEKGVSIVLYDRTGAAVTYESVETLTTDTPVEGKTETFTHGVLLEGTEIELSMETGDQFVSVPDGYLVREAILKKPETMKPEHIKKGVDIGGVVGTFAGDEIEKNVELNFGKGVVISSETEMENILMDENNMGKCVKYVGDDGKYLKDTYYIVRNTYEEFEAEKCESSVAEITSDTTLTSSVECRKGDLIIAAFVARSNVVSISDDWTLISTSEDMAEINSTATVHQTLSFAYKYATDTTEMFSVTQEAAGRIYINMVAFTDAVGFVDNGYQYMNAEVVEDSTKATFERPDGEIILWGLTRASWNTNGVLWETSEKLALIQLGSETQPRLLLAIDTTESEEMTFVSHAQATTDVQTCGCLSIQMKRFSYRVAEAGELEILEQQVIEADADTVMKKVTVMKPETMSPENIKKGVDVGGVVGSFIGDGKEKTVDLDMVAGDQVVEADANTVLSKVVVKKPEMLTPENIVKGANIGGVIGTHTGEFGIYASGGNERTWLEPEHIAGSAFTHNKTFTKESFPNVLDVGGYAFYGASNLMEIDMPLCEKVGTYAFAYCSKLQDVNMPNCKSLGTYAFYSCITLEKACFPNCVSIGSYAFQTCSGIKELSFPAISELSTIATTAFNFVANSGLVARFDNITFLPSSTSSPLRLLSKYLTELYAPKCTVISVYGLSGFNKLSKIVMSGAEANISTWGCYGCSSLAGVYAYSESEIVNAAVKPSGASCFAYCSALKTISIAAYAYGGIGSYAFRDCINLESLGVKAEETGVQVETIYTGAFMNCYKIPKFSIRLRNSTEKLSIAASAFYGCSMLSQVYIDTNIWSVSTYLSSLGANAFANTPMSNSGYLGYYGSIYVPSSMLAWFKAKTGWSLYSERMVGY